jgi:hypothetical protein
MLDFQTGTVSGKAGKQMDWTITHLNLSKVMKLIYGSYDFVIHEKK